jgi:hypothetical protein
MAILLVGRLDRPTPLTGCGEAAAVNRDPTEPGETGDFGTRESVARDGAERWGFVVSRKGSSPLTCPVRLRGESMLVDRRLHIGGLALTAHAEREFGAGLRELRVDK